MITLGCHWFHPYPRDSIRIHMVTAVNCSLRKGSSNTVPSTGGTVDDRETPDAASSHAGPRRVARVLGTPVTRTGPGGSGEVSGRQLVAARVIDDQRMPNWPGAQTLHPSGRQFGGSHDQVPCAREFVRQTLGQVPVLDEVVLLASELCTNALQHTASGHGGTFHVVVRPGSCSVRVEVHDDGSAQAPAVHVADPFSEAGRGLELMELIADRWGFTGGRHGRSVFFELSWTESE